MDKVRKKRLFDFVSSLKLSIKNFDLLNISLTHSSFKFKNNHLSPNNERLEFFGDAILKVYISEYLLEKYPDYSEGELSKLRAFVVSEKVLEKISDSLSICDYILTGRNEKRKLPASILADSLEALLAVIYYDCGPNVVKSFILSNWSKYIEQVGENLDKDNFKAILQEYLQSKKLGLPKYVTVSELGPDHNKNFNVAVFLNQNQLGSGNGKTKKEASQQAAKDALNKLGIKS